MILLPISKAPDGSVHRADGMVLFFSVERFEREICEGGHCFICGAAPGTTPFNDEHILPQWLLRKFALHGRRITLPNLSGYRYDQYTIPCCASCNATMGDEIEQPVSQLVSQGLNAVSEHIRVHGPKLFVAWLALIFIKTHLKDRYIRSHPDPRIATGNIADMYEWRELHHIHCIARSFYTRAVWEPGVVGSFAVMSADVQDGMESFDYGDLYQARTMMLRIDDMCFYIVLNDACAALSRCSDLIEKISGSMSPLQLRELMARFAMVNLALKNRPEFFTSVSMEEGVSVHAKHDSKIELDDAVLRQYGTVLHGVTWPILSALDFPNKAQLEDDLKHGTATFLLDEQGSFNRKSFRRLSAKPVAS